jgi:hypothetical protein
MFRIGTHWVLTCIQGAQTVQIHPDPNLEPNQALMSHYKMVFYVFAVRSYCTDRYKNK